MSAGNLMRIANDIPKIGWRPELDGIRGLMSVTVFLYHMRLPKIGGGFLSVDVFFALSGFLITTLLLEEAAASGGIAFGRFYARRAARLLPALFVAMAFVAILPFIHAEAGRHSWSVHRGVLASLFYVNNWASALGWFFSYGTTQTWSLSIEEQFYLVWPWVVGLAIRTRRPLIATAVAALAGIIVPVILRAHLWTGRDELARVYFGTDTRMDTIFWGCLLAVLWRAGFIQRFLAQKIRANAVTWIGVAMLGAGFLTLRKTWASYYVWGLPFVAFATTVLLAGIMMAPEGLAARLLRIKPFVWLGRRSYAFYLWHWPLVWANEFKSFSYPRVIEGTVIFSVSLLVTHLSWRFVEEPIQRYARRRFARAE